MVQVIIIEKNGEFNYNKITDINDLYKKCGFRKSDGFEIIDTYIDNKNNVMFELWGRSIGKENTKNEYIFPRLIEKNIYGKCAIIAKNNEYIDLTIEKWNIYCNSLDNNLNDLNNLNNLSEQISDKMDGITNEIEKLTTLSLEKLTCKSDNSGSSITSELSDCSEINETSDEDDDENNSELKSEAYIYSSEEEIIS